ncbi:UNVERIFIED_CONTAM: hypothetical protein Sradi_5296800 [Sesamum radiatum]|uniref:Uncharacterized protein n=1 Tax=Sesamum radiatum TaxID=300843 RepID=A0AAW2LNW6_SESRA
MPLFVEAFGSHAFPNSSGLPQLASLPSCFSATISKLIDASPDGKEHPYSASALRRLGVFIKIKKPPQPIGPT